jgi:hypothetical protein
MSADRVTIKRADRQLVVTQPSVTVVSSSGEDRNVVEVSSTGDPHVTVQEPTRQLVTNYPPPPAPVTVVKTENVITAPVEERRIVEVASVEGLRGEPGSKILRASGPPTGDIGRDGDYYIDDSAPGLPLYGPKQNGQWPDLVIYSNDISRHVHTQAVPSTTWVVNHLLGGFPSVTVVDSANTAVHGMVTYVSETQVVLTFSAPFSGSAYLT